MLERLAVLVVLRHRARILARHLDKVSFTVPIADLEGLDAGLEALFGLEAGKPLVGAVAEISGLVQLRGVAGADDLPILLGDSRRDELPHSRRLLHRPEHPREELAILSSRGQRRFERSDSLQRSFEGE